MAAYVAVHARIKDPEKLAAYQALIVNRDEGAGMLFTLSETT